MVRLVRPSGGRVWRRSRRRVCHWTLAPVVREPVVGPWCPTLRDHVCMCVWRWVSQLDSQLEQCQTLPLTLHLTSYTLILHPDR